MKIDPHGLFIGLVNLPLTQEESFNENFVENIFKSYSESLRNISGTNLHDSLYKPISYILFGNYDMGIISLVDDSVFSLQKFKPNSEIILDNSENTDLNINYNFNYQVLHCSKFNYNIPKNTLLNLFEEIVLPKPNKDSASFISITTLKIRSSLIIGSGIRINQLIHEAIDNCIKNEEKKIKYIVLETNSWHEYVILLFSNDIDLLCKKVVEIRDLKFESIKKLDILQLKDNSKIYKKSLLYKLKKEISENEQIFSTSYTYLGLDYRVLLDKELIKNLKDSKLKVALKWHTKPGHTERLISIVNKHINSKTHNKKFDNKINAIYGNGDLEFDFFDDIKKIVGYYSEMINESKNESNSISNAKEVRNLSRKTRSIPKLEIVVSPNENFSDLDINTVRNFIEEKLSITKKELIHVDVTLCKHNVSKAVRQRILKLLNNYNSGIQDTSLYIYFIDLRPFVKNIISYANSLEKAKNVDSYDIHSKLNQIANIFDLAYRNRIHHSNRTIELSDFSLEFNGGIQQVVSAYDTIFKIFRDNFSYNKGKEIYPIKSSFLTYFCGEPGVYSGLDFLQLNISQLIQPEVFIASIFKESLNNYIPSSKHSYEDITKFKNLILKNDIGKLNSELVLLQPNIRDQINTNKVHIYLFISLVNTYSTSMTNLIEHKILSFIANSKKLKNNKNLFNILSYVKLLNHESYDYLLLDQLNFINYFLLDTQIYSKWIWIQFLQEPLSYNIDGTLNEDKFCKVLFRLIFTRKIYNNHKEYLNTSISDNNLFEFLISNKTLNYYFKEHNKSMQSFVDILFDSELKLLNFFNFSSFEFLTLNNIIQNKIDIGKSRNLVSKYHKNFEDFIHNGTIPNSFFNKITSTYLTADLTCFFQAYLKLLTNYIDSNNLMVNRSNLSGQVQNMSKMKAGIYIDPHGGLYISGEFREAYNRLRNLFLKFVVNIAQQQKIKYLPNEKKQG